MNKHLIKFTLLFLIAVFCREAAHAQLGGVKYQNSGIDADIAMLNDSDCLGVYTHSATPNVYDDTIGKEIRLYADSFTLSYFAPTKWEIHPRVSNKRPKVDSMISGEWHFCRSKREFKKFSIPSVINALKTNKEKLIVLKCPGRKLYALIYRDFFYQRVFLALQENKNFFSRLTPVTRTEFYFVSSRLMKFRDLPKLPTRESQNVDTTISFEGH